MTNIVNAIYGANEKGKTMRENLIELIRKIDKNVIVSADMTWDEIKESMYSQMADMLIANGVTIQRWISVTERLPKPEDNPVLVTYDGGVWMAWKHSTHWELPGTLKTNRVTHWKPMPEPPKE